ncbi:amidohydrolase family protein, partial [Streptomyces noursei]
VSSPDPLAGLHVAVNRKEPDTADERVFLPEQRLDLGTAVAAYTAGSAHVNGLDDAGTLRVGHLADLVVLDRDVFTAPPEEIARATVLETYVGGRRVYTAD